MTALAGVTRLPGLALMGFSALSFSIMAAAIKLVAHDGLPSSEIVFFRGLLCSVLTIAALRADRSPILGTRRGLLVLRGLFGFAGLYLYCEALGLLELPDAMALQYTHPIFAAVFAAIFLREKMPKGSGIAMAICAAGALVILDPFGTGPLTGNLIALASGVSAGLAYTVVRSLSRTESALTIMLSFHLAAFFIGGVWMLPEFVWPEGVQWAWLVVIALVSQAGQWFLTHGLRKEKAGPATTVGYTAIAFGAVWSYLFFDEAIGWKVVVGTVLMVLGLAVLSRRRA